MANDMRRLMKVAGGARAGGLLHALSLAGAAPLSPRRALLATRRRAAAYAHEDREATALPLWPLGGQMPHDARISAALCALQQEKGKGSRREKGA